MNIIKKSALSLGIATSLIFGGGVASAQPAQAAEPYYNCTVKVRWVDESRGYAKRELWCYKRLFSLDQLNPFVLVKTTYFYVPWHRV